MPRHSGSGGVRHTRRQKGYSRKGHGIGTYSRMCKSRVADRYDRPLLDGTYNKPRIFPVWFTQDITQPIQTESRAMRQNRGK